MEIEVRQIGAIKEGSIKVNGLTILAGHNDSGKSTIGKLLFAITKAISRYEEDFREDLESKILARIEKIYFRVRKYKFLLKIDDSIEWEIRRLFFPPYFLKDVDLEGQRAVEKREIFIKRWADMPEKREILHLLEELKLILGKDKLASEKEAIEEALNRVFISEFEDQLISKKNRKGSVVLKEEGREIVKIEIIYTSGRYKVRLEEKGEGGIDGLRSIFFKDATFIETPVVLNYQEAFENAKSYFEIRTEMDKLRRLGRPNIQFHTRDLDLKLKEKVYEEKNSSILQKIEKVIGGRVVFDKKRREFLFRKVEKGENVKIINTASGIKSFGIIQLLLKTSFLEERTLLIIDEPEVHLHPIWQLKYAEVIAMLIKEGISVVTTSHNPYMVDALNLYAEKEGIKNWTNLYLVEEGIVTETGVGRIFKSLGDPIEELRKLRYQLLEKKLDKQKK